MEVNGRGRAILATVATSGITLQLAQKEDATPAYMYFTVWSAGFVVVSCILSAQLSVMGAWARVASTTSAVLSGLVYLVAIAPVRGFGHEPPTILANVFLHILLPGAILLQYFAHIDWRFGTKMLLTTLVFPASFLAFVIVLFLASHRAVYVFLNPDEIGWLGVAVSAFLAAVLHVLVGLALARLSGWSQNHLGKT